MDFKTTVISLIHAHHNIIHQLREKMVDFLKINPELCTEFLDICVTHGVLGEWMAIDTLFQLNEIPYNLLNNFTLKTEYQNLIEKQYDQDKLHILLEAFAKSNHNIDKIEIIKKYLNHEERNVRLAVFNAFSNIPDQRIIEIANESLKTEQSSLVIQEINDCIENIQDNIKNI